VVSTIIGALAVASLLVSHWHGVPVEVFLALILAFYSVGAHCGERRAPLAGGAALASPTGGLPRPCGRIAGGSRHAPSPA
jgi:hypothetical protein